MMMIGTGQLAKTMYEAWRVAAPVEGDLPPEWKSLNQRERARWRYVAEITGQQIAEAIGARETVPA